MAVKERTPDRASKQYLVACDGCGFKQTVGGQEEAKRSADTHKEETRHELVVVEWPLATAPPS